MKVIGHRGAAGLELENTLASLKKAIEIGVDGVEFDVRMTSDRHLVLCHDPDISRISEFDFKINEMSLEELKSIKLNNGETVPTLDEALAVLGSTWAIIEMKVDDCVTELLAAIDRHPGCVVTIATFLHDLGAEIETQRPRLEVFLAEHIRPTEIIKFVRNARANGIDLNAWLLNPLTYWLARRRDLKIMVYTVNWSLIGWFIHKLYPGVALCTDHPERFQRLRR